MIITISGANFSASNIGTLSSYLVRYTGNVTGNVTSVAKNDAGTAAKNALTATITMKSGYTYNSLSVTVNGSTITGYTATDNGNGTVTLTVPANLITGTVVVAVVTTGTSVTPPVTPDPEPEEPGTGGGSGTTTSIRVTDFSDAYRAMVNATTGEYKNQQYNENVGGSQVINKYDIPSGATQVNYQVFKTGGGYGSGFEDAGGNWISGYANTDENLQRHTLDIPSNASKFVFMYMDNGYADHQGKPRFDYIEFLGVFEGSGESGGSGDTPSESVKSYTYETTTRGLLDVKDGTYTSMGEQANGTQVINNHTIPSGATKVKYQTFKTGKTYGSGFVDASGNWISGYAENNNLTGTWKTLSIPSGAVTFKHMYPDSTYIKTMDGYDSSWDFQYVEFLFS